MRFKAKIWDDSGKGVFKTNADETKILSEIKDFFIIKGLCDGNKPRKKRKKQ